MLLRRVGSIGNFEINLSTFPVIYDNCELQFGHILPTCRLASLIVRKLLEEKDSKLSRVETKHNKGNSTIAKFDFGKLVNSYGVFIVLSAIHVFGGELS